METCESDKILYKKVLNFFLLFKEAKKHDDRKNIFVFPIPFMNT